MRKCAAMTKVLRPAEFVLPGHPDKLCDAIADALVQEAARRERRALCGVEVAVHHHSVYVTGRIACRDAGSIDIAAAARAVYAGAGYGGVWRPRPEDLRVEADVCVGPLEEGEADFRAVADDQAIVTGYAVDLPAMNFLPPEHWLAWRLSLRLGRLRSEAPELRLGPDGKVLVLLEESDTGIRLVALSASLQQAAGGPSVELHRAVQQAARTELEHAAQALPRFDARLPDAITLNGAGEFVICGPIGDNGLSGKKLVVDAYGPRVPIGGGALSGKDFFKADRAGALIARRLAKAVVLTGSARECLATLAFAPGDREARLLGLSDGERLLDPTRWLALLDRSLAGVGERFSGQSDLVEVARNGHFTEPQRPWEALHFDGCGLRSVS
jgi:S-adenosylmethionine synthetase